MQYQQLTRLLLIHCFVIHDRSRDCDILHTCEIAIAVVAW